jgi:hypothetical protein
MGALGRAGSGAARSWGLVDRDVGGAGAPCVWLLASPCTTRGDHTVTVLLVRLRHERAFGERERVTHVIPRPAEGRRRTSWWPTAVRSSRPVTRNWCPNSRECPALREPPSGLLRLTVLTASTRNV